MRVLVTRPAEQARELVDLLAARGLAGVSVPSVAIRHEPAGSPFDAALDGLTGAAWLVITSANGALALAARLRAMRRGMPSGTRLAAVGPATAATLRGAGFTVHHMPDDYLTAAIADGLGELHGRRVVLARADAATPELVNALRARGAAVEEVVAYRTLEAPPSAAPMLGAALRDGLHAISLTSGSTARGLAQLGEALPAEQARSLRRLPVFAIGPVTARAAQRAGFPPTAVATVHTAEALADTIAATLTAATLTAATLTHQEAR